MFNIHTLFIGKKIIHLPTCQSTNDVAIHLLENSDICEGTTIITDHQTAGKGQRGASWEAQPYQNITLSIILFPTFLRPMQQFCLNLAISLGVFQFLKNYLGNAVKIKWPNDIYYKDKKICGILIQNFLKGNALDKAVVGIGINVNQTQFLYPSASSMQLISSKSYIIADLVNDLCQSLETNYLKLKTMQLAALEKEYLANLYAIGEKRTFKNLKTDAFFEGEIIGIDEIGRLKISTAQDILVFDNKEVSFVG